MSTQHPIDTMKTLHINETLDFWSTNTPTVLQLLLDYPETKALTLAFAGIHQPRLDAMESVTIATTKPTPRSTSFVRSYQLPDTVAYVAYVEATDTLHYWK
jgi:hypothetical protein